MADPEEGEWDIDVVIDEGRVKYVDLRVRPELLTDFGECLINDVDEEQANRVVRRVIDRRDLDIQDDATD